MEAEYDGTIFSLFSVLDKVFLENKLPDKIIRKDISLSLTHCAGELFNTLPIYSGNKVANTPYAAHKYFEACRNSFSGQEIIKYSGKAYKDILYAWMSDFPVEKEIIHFAWKIVSAGRMQEMENEECNNSSKKQASSAERARCDLADISVKKVMECASKARKESHFLAGVLRFSIGSSNIAIARCSPDHFILPALTHHFTLRFGNSNWAIIDEKRNISLMHAESKPTQLTIFDPAHSWFTDETGSSKECFDDWEKMWKNYHTSINNESRNNPNLQKRFIPVRYWKYLPEFNDKVVKK